MKKLFIVVWLVSGYLLITSPELRSYVHDKCDRISVQLATDAAAVRAFEGGDAVQTP
jgi:hypothetical protein